MVFETFSNYHEQSTGYKGQYPYLSQDYVREL